MMQQDNLADASQNKHASDEEYSAAQPLYGPGLPSFDKSKMTQIASLSGLGLVWLVGILCIVGASLLFIRPFSYTVNSETLRLPSGLMNIKGHGSVYGFIVTMLITGCTESTGFVHDVSLRWMLFQEDRLHWTTNMRLFSTSRVSMSTRSASNLLYFVTLAMAYTASSQIFVYTAFAAGVAVGTEDQSGSWGGLTTLASGASLMALGVCLVLQAAVVTWIYLSSKEYIKTWSSNPLTIALACVSTRDQFAHARLGYKVSSVVSTAQRLQLTKQALLEEDAGLLHFAVPRSKQANLLTTRKTASRWVLAMVSVLPVAVLIWAAIVLRAWKSTGYPISFDEMDDEMSKITEVASSVSGSNSGPPAIQPFPWQQGGWSESSPLSPSMTNFVCLLLVFCMQSYLTLTLHCAEVLVNSARDQNTWAQAGEHLENDSAGAFSRYLTFFSRATSYRNARKSGALLDSNIIASFLACPPNIFLLAAKAVAHWLFNRSLLPVMFLAEMTNADDSRLGTKVWQVSQVQIELYGIPTFFLAGVALILMAQSWYIAFRCPRGQQPSTYGHIHSLIEIIDDWGDGTQLFWGDKGKVDDGQYRRAGTAADVDRVGPIESGVQYI